MEDKNSHRGEIEKVSGFSFISAILATYHREDDQDQNITKMNTINVLRYLLPYNSFIDKDVG